RELNNIEEKISVLSQDKIITGEALRRFLPRNISILPVLASGNVSGANPKEFSNEREILYKLFFDMKKDVTELKKMFFEIMQNPALANNPANFTSESLQKEYALNGEVNYNNAALATVSQHAILYSGQ